MAGDTGDSGDLVLNVSQLQRELRRFTEERDWEQFHSPKNLAMALAGEAGELLEIFQWLSEAQASALGGSDLSASAEELPDIQIYLLRLSDKLGIDLGDAVRHKIAANERKYPISDLNHCVRIRPRLWRE